MVNGNTKPKFGMLLSEGLLQFPFAKAADKKSRWATPEPDRRVARVSNKNEKSGINPAGQSLHQPKTALDSDGLLGSLILEHFAGAVFLPFLPFFLQSMNLSNMVEIADTVWQNKTAQIPEISYF